MEIRLKFVWFVSSALLALVAADCTKFEFNKYDVDNYTEGINPYTTERPEYRVTPLVNCTAELAQNDGGDSSTCSFHRYSMGLIAHPRAVNETYIGHNYVMEEYLHVDPATEAHLLSLVQAANPPNITSGNLNATIVMNFTTNVDDQPDIPYKYTAFYGFTPTYICWNGTLAGCNSTDGLEGARIQACGLQWLDDKQYLLPPGQQKYKGRLSPLMIDGFLSFYQDYTHVHGSLADASADPWPTYDELAGNATVNQMDNETTGQVGGDDDDNDNGDSDDDKSSASIVDLSFFAFMGLATFVAISNCL
ncbi:hypothetical protein GGR58DRAFT_468266 [Xylaria digitata]|nr:hypothetical protein GGR58DRAFT_468266 [Xylaria digitata]